MTARGLHLRLTRRHWRQRFGILRVEIKNKIGLFQVNPHFCELYFAIFRTGMECKVLPCLQGFGLYGLAGLLVNQHSRSILRGCIFYLKPAADAICFPL